MADVLILALGAVIVMAGSLAVALVVRAGKRGQALERQQRPARLRAELDQIDQRIRRVNQAATDAELDRLERHKEQ